MVHGYKFGGVLTLTARPEFRALVSLFHPHNGTLLYFDYLVAGFRYRTYNNETSMFLHVGVFEGCGASPFCFVFQDI